MPAEPSPVAEPDSLEDQIHSCMLQRQNLEAVLDCVADGVVAADLSLRVSNLNHAAQTILGWTRAEALGQPCSRVLGTTDDGGELDQVLRQRRPVDALSVTAHSRSGQPLRLVVSTRILRDHSGGERGVVAIVCSQLPCVQLYPERNFGCTFEM